ncbi:peroxiredoxin [Leucobacter aridicollis]|uniref:peroxiredoxin n=1 Tax=Leucobacter aridicollis TaxID=283878 RepID=UPI00210560F8|nr:peroxiredoxin [Leucobacter aridicollis]UTX52015.1 peroxiredoxin [Leucobacter aridicollis]
MRATTQVPQRAFPSTVGDPIDLSALPGRSVLFVYPRTSPPEGAPSGWEMLPGARGCTAETCSFRDLASEFAAQETAILGLSTQDRAYQAEAAARLHLPYPLLSDSALALASPLGLATFSFQGARLYRRATLVLEAGAIVHRFTEISDPGGHPAEVLSWLAAADS